MQGESKGRDWSAIFDNYEQSGLNQVKFCEREGIKFFEFQYQRTKYLKQRPQRSKVSGFLPIRVKDSASYGIEIRLPEGISLKLMENTSVDYIKRLLSILR